MSVFRKRPVEVEAFRFDFEVWPQWFWDSYRAGSVKVPDVVAPAEARIQTLEGVMTAASGDWIIRGVEGELYPCKDSVFRATYDEVVSTAAGVAFAGLGPFIAADKAADQAVEDVLSAMSGDRPKPGWKSAGTENMTGFTSNQAPASGPVTKWRVLVHLGTGQTWPLVSLAYSSEQLANQTVGLILDAMGNPGGPRHCLTFTHDDGVASFFAADVKVVQKQPFKDYGDGEDF